MAKQLLTERVAAPFDGVRVTGSAEAPVIENVLLCGPVSANLRRYLREAFAGDRVKRYNGVPVKITPRHGDVNGNYAEQIGIIQNARHRPADGMPIGDIAVNPHKEGAQAFVWDARNNPKACGMSHVADCDTKKATDGWDEVTEMVHPHSVDVIGAGRAATTKGLAESRRTRGVSTTLRAVIEKFRTRLKEQAAQKAARKLLLAAEEDGDMGAMMDAPVEAPPDDADGGDAIDDAFKQLMHSALDKLLDDSHSLSEFISNIRELYKTRAKITGSGSTTGGDDDDPDDPPKEGKKRPDLAAVLKECTDKGFTPDTAQMVAIAGVPTPAGRAALIESLKKATEGQGRETPRSSPRAGTQTTRTQPTAESKLPEDPKAFAARYRE